MDVFDFGRINNAGLVEVDQLETQLESLLIHILGCVADIFQDFLYVISILGEELLWLGVVVGEFLVFDDHIDCRD